MICFAGCDKEIKELKKVIDKLEAALNESNMEAWAPFKCEHYNSDSIQELMRKQFDYEMYMSDHMAYIAEKMGISGEEYRNNYDAKLREWHVMCIKLLSDYRQKLERDLPK